MKSTKYFYILYFLIFSSTSISMGYTNLYFKDIGFSGTEISIIVSIGALVTIISQIVWGRISDKAKNKKILIFWLVVMSVISFCLIKFNNSFLYIILVNIVFSFFYYSVQPLIATITLSHVKKFDKNYGYIRILGTIGFCITSVIFGSLNNNSYIFVTFTIICSLIVIILFKINFTDLPIKTKNKNKITNILKNKELQYLLIYSGLINVTYGVYFNFFGIYYTNAIGASTKMYGVLSAIATLCEIPFLLCADKLIKKMGTNKILLFAGIFTSTRWLLTFIVDNMYLQILVQSIHGLGFIVILTTMTIYLQNNIDENFKSQGQTIFAMITVVSSKAIGSLVGGVIGDSIGEKNVFLLIFVISTCSTIWLYYKCKKINIIMK